MKTIYDMLKRAGVPPGAIETTNKGFVLHSFEPTGDGMRRRVEFRITRDTTVGELSAHLLHMHLAGVRFAPASANK